MDTAIDRCAEQLVRAHEGDTDAVVTLVAQLRETLRTTGNSEEAVALVATLGRLVHGDVAAQTAAADALVMVGAMLATGTRLVQRVAAATTLLLLHENVSTQAVAVAAGIVSPLVSALASPTDSVVSLALLALRELTDEDREGQAVTFNARAIVPLARIAHAGVVADRPHAKTVLVRLTSNERVLDAMQRRELDAMTETLGPRVADEDVDHANDDAVSPANALAVVTRFAAEAARHRLDARDGGERDAMHALMVSLRDAPASGVAWEELLALEELSAFIWEGDAHAKAAAVAAGAMPLLRQRLASPTSDDALQHCAAFALMALLGADHALQKDVLATLGLGELVELLSSGGRNAVLFVLCPLMDQSADARTEVAAAGVVPALTRVLRDGHVRERFLAVRVLNRLLLVDAAVREEAMSAGAVESLLHFLAHTDAEDARLHALTTLSWLVDKDATRRAVFVDAGGASVLMRLMAESSRLERFRVAEMVLALVATGDTVTHAAFVEAGAVGKLLRMFLECNSVPELSTAALALGHLAEKNVATKRAVAPVLARLVQVLRTARDGLHQAQAAQALGLVASGDAASQEACAEAEAIPELVRVLAFGGDAEAQAAAAALGALVHDHAANRVAVLQANAVLVLVVLLRRGPERGEATARRTLAYLLGHSTEPHEPAAVECELLQLLVRSLNDDHLTASSIQYLVTNSEANQSLAVAAGAVNALVRAMQSSYARQQTPVATIPFAYLVERHAAAKTQALEAGAVGVLVGALVDCDDAKQLVDVLTALRSLVDNHAAVQRAFLTTPAALPRLRVLLAREATMSNVATLLRLLMATSPAAAADAIWKADLVAPLMALIASTSDDSIRADVLQITVRLATDDTTCRLLSELFPVDTVLALLPAATGGLKVCAETALIIATQDDPVLRKTAIDGGVLAVAIEWLETIGPFGVGPPCVWIAALVAEDKEAERLAVAAGVVDTLCGLMRTVETDQRTSVAIALASISAAQDKAMGSGVLPFLLEHLQRPTREDECTDESGPLALANLVDRHTENQVLVARAGAIPLLLTLLTSSVSTKFTRHIARALAQLVASDASIQVTAKSAAAIARLSELLDGGCTDEQTVAYAKAALAWLTEGGPAAA